MRRFLFCLIAGLMSFSVYAQTSQQLLEAAKKATKGDVKKENLAAAEKAVDDALNASENQAGYEAYLYKAKLLLSQIKLDENNRAMTLVTKKEFKPEYPKAAMTAVSALLTAMKNTKDPKATKEIVKTMNEVAPFINQSASDFSEAKDYVGAYQSFKASLDVHEALKAAGQKGNLEKPEDYNKQLYLVGLLSNYAGKEAETVSIYEKLIENKMDSAFVYSSLFKIKYDSDPKAAMVILEAGRKRHPDETSLLFLEINHYLKMGQLDVLIEKLKQGIEREPDNLSLYFTMGNVYDNLAQKETDSAKSDAYATEALNWYKKTLEKDPKNADAVYSIGAYYYNRAAKISAEIKKIESDMSKEGQKKYDKFTQEMLAEFDQALPFFQKSEALDPNNQNALVALKEIYARKNDMAMTKEFKARLDNVTSGEKNATSYFKQ